MKIKIIILLLFALLFQGCVTTSYLDCRSSNVFSIYGILDGDKEMVAKYELEYLIDEDSVRMYRDYYQNHREFQGNAEVYYETFRSNWIYEPKFGCGYPSLRGTHKIKIYLKDVTTKKRILLAEKRINMRDYPNAQLLTQIYFGNDRSRYKPRVKNNICWNKLKPLKFEYSNDVIYHYTTKYMSDDKKEFNNAYMIEVPEE